jgi:hypothetical protein
MYKGKNSPICPHGSTALPMAAQYDRKNLFALLELARIAGRRKVTQIQIKLFMLVSVNSSFSFQLR